MHVIRGDRAVARRGDVCALGRAVKLVALLSGVALSACTHMGGRGGDLPGRTSIVGPLTNTAGLLVQLPPAPRQIAVAVYDFPDLTGQRKPTTAGIVTDLSTAVSQGSSSIVIEALKSAGSGTYFDVVDRTRDADQARERTIIAESAGVNVTELTNKKKPLPKDKIRHLRPAEYIL